MQLDKHKKEVSYLSFDTKNNLLLSCGFDNKVIVSNATKDDTSVVRVLRFPLGSEEILFCKASFYLNYIATANDKAVLIWNYENMKLMGVCYIYNLDIRDIYFLDPYPILVVLD